MPPLVVASIIARAPYAMTSVATVLFVAAEKDSFAAAGLVTGTLSLSGAVLGPTLGRAVDRRGQGGVIVAAAVWQLVVLSSLVALGLADAPLLTLVACAALGGTMPPVSAALRQLWPGVVRDDPGMTQSAFALDAIVLEAIFVSGPLLVGLLVAFASPQAAILTGAVLSVVGSVWFAAHPASRAWHPRARPATRRSPMRFAGLRTLMLTAVGIGVIFGTFEVCFAKFGTDEGAAWAAGALIACQAAGSAIGGLWFGRHALDRAALVRVYLVLAVAFPVTSVLVAGAPSILLAMPLAVLAGMPFAPLSAAESLLIPSVTPEDVRTEAYTWIITAIIVGVAIGATAAGPAVDGLGWRVTLVCACALGLAAAAFTLARRSTLTAPVPG